MEKKEMYVAPEVEVLEIAVEKGFAATGGFEGPNLGDDTDLGMGE